MTSFSRNKEEISTNGFSVIANVYTQQETDQILTVIQNANADKSTFRKSEDLFAIRQFFKEVPASLDIIFNDHLKSIIRTIAGDDYFVVKSIYFDKPPVSNWYVAYHQDLTISVNSKVDLDGYSSWTVKQNQFAVMPPLDILKDIFTIRIHLDDTDSGNGALKVIRSSHLKEIYRPETIDRDSEEEVTCRVPKGGIMIMKPLLLHSSGKSTNGKQRRVIHIEFSKKELPDNLDWAEKIRLS